MNRGVVALDACDGPSGGLEVGNNGLGDGGKVKLIGGGGLGLGGGGGLGLGGSGGDSDGGGGGLGLGGGSRLGLGGGEYGQVITTFDTEYAVFDVLSLKNNV